jgi:PiT family inorganic phosphate transporter
VLELAIIASIAFAFMLGIADAPNATSALIGTRACRYRTAVAFSFVFHALGALLGGTAVAITITGLIEVPSGDVPAAYAAAAGAAVVFTAVATRRSIPTSASYALVGGLVGAALVSQGVDGIVWGGVDGIRPEGVLGVLLGMALSPVLGVAAAAGLSATLGRGGQRVSRRAARPVRGATWGAAALVALSDGTNDGQKAMGLAAGALVAAGSLDRLEIPLWVRVLVALALATGTAVGGRRLVRAVGEGIYRLGAVDGLAAQTSAAGVILAAGAVGAPVSTSNVVASSVVGVGANRRPRHVQWAVVGQTASAWVLTIPASAALGALAFAITGRAS